MLVTLAVVVALPFAFVYALGSVPNVLRFLFTEAGGNLIPSYDPLLVGGFVGVVLLGQYALGGRVAPGMEHPETVDESEYPRLHAAASRYAGIYDLPDQTVAVVDNDAPNAFVTGRSVGGSTLVVTEGLLDTLDDDELDAVVAHELAHIRNRDGPLMSVARVLPTTAHSIAVSAWGWLRALFDRGDPADSRPEDPYSSAEALPGSEYRGEGGVNPITLVLTLPFVALFLLTIAIGLSFWAVSTLVFVVLSRHREYAADEAAAEATGEPAAMASALRSLDDGLSEAPDEDLRELRDGPEALFVLPVDAGNFDEDDGWLPDAVPSRHGLTEERIERLQSIAADGEVGTTAD